MIYLYAFLIGGAICALAELIKDLFKLTNGHMTVIFVCLGTLLSFLPFYKSLVEIAGAGVLLPITNFGYNMSEACFEGAMQEGFVGLFKNVYAKTSAGISFTLLMSVVFSLVFRPKK